jgi:muramoyltetrapeptide carboxypeptidase
MSKYPDFLKEGDEVRIISPSGVIDPTLVDGAIILLASWGYKATEGMFTRNALGRFAGNEQERFTDLQQALDDPNVKAILCSRGGYGLAQIIDRIDFSRFVKHPKWVIGFSDVTILHQALLSTGIISLHSAMAKQFTELPAKAEPLVMIENILRGDIPSYKITANKHNRSGIGKGKLIGGNLSVFMGMRGTGYDLPFKNSILFIEDIGEKPYQIDRMMQNLRISGALSQLSGLLIGQFTEYEEDPEMNKTLFQIIADAVKEYNYPVCYNFSAGHVDNNFPLLMGANAELKVTDRGASLSFQTTFWKKAGNLLNL